MRNVVMSFMLALGLGLSPSPRAAGPAREPVRGFVDGSKFLDVAGADAGTVEVSLQGALLKALIAADPELAKLARGLESIHAVIVEPKNAEALRRTREMAHETERKLVAEGWERVARIKDEGANVAVLVLNEGQDVRGLVVLVADEDQGEVVFANVAGLVDLAAIASLGRQLEIPGLERMDDEHKD